MSPKHREGDVVFSFSGAWISYAHTIVAYAAFLGALVVGIWLHYHKIVQNEHYGYPEEWFPSVSATIGDRYPERSVFQLFIAITSGPRFALVGLFYVLTARPNATLPKVVGITGIFRTLTCGGWTYITSTDDHDWHDIFMISYLVATLPWTLGCLALSPPNPTTVKWRKILAGAFFGTLVPLVYFFIQHKIHKVAGAYTIYAFFEWALVLLDVAFDAVTALDFDSFELVVKDVKGTSRRDVKHIKDKVLDDKKDKEVAQVFHSGFSWAETWDAAADVYNGFVFWSILTSLGLLVWYFPLWYMGISGYEAMVLTTISPLLLGIPHFRRFALRNLRLLYLLTLAGPLAYLVEKPDLRLFTVGFGVWMGCLAWTATFYAERSQPHRLEARVAAFVIGLIASSVAKYANQSNNPIWPVMHAENGGWNRLGIFLGVLAALRATRSSKQNTLDVSLHGAKKGSSLLAALGMGGLLFAMHAFLSDSSTLISWVWEGFPVRGPLAVPHGSYTILAMGFGLAVGLFFPEFSRSWTAYGIGCVGAGLLTTRSHWSGFTGALMLAAYVVSIAPALVASAVRHGPAKTFGSAFMFYNAMVFFSVWIVAYAFVPGGPFFREHTDWMMITTMLMLGAGIFNDSTSSPTRGGKSPKKPANPAARRTRSYYVYVLMVLQILSVSVSFLRFPTYDYEPYHPEASLITAGIWTIHFALDNPMWDSSRRMRDLIKELELDVIGLLESDTQRIIMGNRDPTQFLAEDLGMYVDYGPGPNKHTWGCALLSKFPIVNSTHHLLPSPVGELAPAIAATIDAYGTLVDVYVFHSGQEEDPEDRRLQSEYLARLMGSSDRPSILLSYLVVKPGEGNYNTYVSDISGMKDIDSTDWDRWCEYILYKNLRKIGYARVSRDSITDTELQVGKFVVGYGENAGTPIDEGSVQPAGRFPQKFKGQGVRGHRYHVFDEPRYYM